MYRSAFAAELRPVDGIEEALERITIPSCVASSGTHEKMRYTLGLTGLYYRFEGRISSATEVGRGKPEPDLFLHAAERMGVTPAACVVVEDSVNGVRTARAAGMRVRLRSSYERLNPLAHRRLLAEEIAQLTKKATMRPDA